MNVKENGILVVGAGPSGLTMALDLADNGIPVRIIDKNKSRSIHSKALGVQAGTLEALKFRFGSDICEEMISSGHQAKGVNFFLDDQPPLTLDLGRYINGNYPFILILEQSETERILENKLNACGVKVERECELFDMKSTSSGYEVKIGSTLDISENYNFSHVIGCDGAHSKVRTLLDIPFSGGSYSGDFYLGDFILDWDLGYKSVNTFITDNGIMACFPMKEDQSYRIILLPNWPVELPATPTISQFQDMVDRISSTKIHLKESDWLTKFHVHHRMAKTYGKSRGFIVGDAAHIHSPVGGQGMYTGIQDALNLAYHLEKVINKKQDGKILARYEKQRLPVARNVVMGTDFVFRIALKKQSFTWNIFKKYVLPFIGKRQFLQSRVARGVSQVAIAQKEIRQRY